MSMTMAITELLRHGPQQWVTEPPGLAGPARNRLSPRGLDADELDDVSGRIVLPALDQLVGIAVASGAVGLWLHGDISCHVTDELRLVAVRGHHPAVWSSLAAHASRAGWTLKATSPAEATLRGPSADLAVRVLCPALPDEAFDGPSGYQRATLADWALAVEALAVAATAADSGILDAAVSRLRFLLEQVPDVLWVHALRSLPADARAPWLAEPHASCRRPGRC